jgi:hypothetical protein
MRQLTVLLAAGCVLVLSGCNSWMNRTGGAVADNTPVTNDPPPTVKQLVDYLNVCSSRVNSLQSNLVYMDCKANHQSFSLDATLVCAKPRDFRLRGRLAGQSACDVGSNNEEFWYWIKQDDPPYLYHCSYEAMSRGNVRLPFPFQPDMVVAALGMGEYNPDPSRYELKVVKNTLELTENSVSVQGQPVTRVTVIARGSVDVTKGRPQVIEYALRDARGADVCKATVERVVVQRGAIVPQKVRLSWPAQKMEMALTLNTVTINGIDPQVAQVAFNRSNMPYKTFDLGRGVPDAPAATIERVRGSQQ